MKQHFDSKANEKLASKVSWVGIWGNLALTIFKLFAGVVGKSGAMVSDGIHSASDVFSTFIVLLSVKLSHKAADSKHPYGHERVECVAAQLLAMVLCVTGAAIGYSGIDKLIHADTVVFAVPSVLALVAAIVSIVSKEAMYWYTILAARKINSSALKASAWHHRSDAFSSVGSFVGILGARLGYPWLDSVASVVICIFIIKAAYDIFMDAVNKMLDCSCDEVFNEEVRQLLYKDKNIVRVDDVKTRLFGDRIYVDLEIALDGDISLYQAHEIARDAHYAVETEFPNVKHCMVHVNPAKNTPYEPELNEIAPGGTGEGDPAEADRVKRAEEASEGPEPDTEMPEAEKSPDNNKKMEEKV